MDITGFVLGNLEATGVIGGYVAVSIVGVALVSLVVSRTMGDRVIAAPRWAHPLIGATLGVIPGCGATIVVSSMYKNGRISFGGLFATFVTTLGEGSFVLLGASDEAEGIERNLEAFVIVNLVGFVVGVVMGTIIDALVVRKPAIELPGDTPASDGGDDGQCGGPIARTIVESVGFYPMLAMALFLFPGSVMALWGGGIDAIEDLTVWVATAFAIGGICYHLVHRFGYAGDCCHDNTSVRRSLIAAMVDVALVIFYVFVGLTVANYVIDELVGPERFDAWMEGSAFVVVVVCALIGATPGCGGMIAVAAAFATIPNFPMAGLVAAAIATSGDGIFPLLAANKRDALLITGVGLVLALIVGYVTLLIGL
ncbi:MAG: putative manganese transporter [Planctomycetota bacterium]